MTSLDDITNVAHTVRRDRTFELRVPSAPIAELHELSCDFNGLLDEIEAWQQHLQQENDALTHQATHDSLTGLPNRAFFEAQLGRALSELEPDEKLAVLFIDGNRFKEVNDNHGHAAGDTVLITIAERLRSRLRKHDLVARMGAMNSPSCWHRSKTPTMCCRLPTSSSSVCNNPLCYPTRKE